MKSIVFFDLEINNQDKIVKVGAVCSKAQIHHNSVADLLDFFKKGDFIAGHNIVQHDWKHLESKGNGLITNELRLIDTLYWSPLLFPQKPYHRLIKDYKLNVAELNNPLTDALLSKIVFEDELAAFQKLDVAFQQILYQLLGQQVGFAGLFEYLDFSQESGDLELLIRQRFKSQICENVDLSKIIAQNPVELAFSLAIIRTKNPESITPPWVYHSFPQVNRVIHLLRNHPCLTGCPYCNERLDANKGLKDFFGFDAYRQFDGQPLQEKVVNLGLKDKSMLVIFPTGGGKSITFQIPALMSGRNVGGLTIVISPLQSLMKDQVDNLERKGITNAVTINGLLNPIERAKAIERVENGSAWLLYISPESLRSKTITNLMLKRKIVRFVIDEAHCFSSWGQDFRVDYLYIGDFIRKLQKLKHLQERIPVSCFTATAKQNVIADIQKYFREKLSLDLELVHAKGARTNLHFEVFEQKNESEKYLKLRDLIEVKDCPTIIYVSRTKKAEELASRLKQDGFVAKAFHGKMDSKIKTKNQDEFINGNVQIMVATSAFGMGVDKDNVKLVVHYEISNSLENYVQEAGRAGRDPKIEADCYVLYNEEDLHKHFVLQSQTQITIQEINQIWKSIKQLTKFRDKIASSALEVAREAGWNDEVLNLETLVRTAINALEQSGYLIRGENSPRVYANSINVKTAQDAIDRINKSDRFNQKQRTDAIRIIKKLFSAKKRSQSDEDAESRVDYIADHLGIVKGKVIEAIELMRREKILANDSDLVAFVEKGKSAKKSIKLALEYARIERFMLSKLDANQQIINLKEWADDAEDADIQEFTMHKAKTILNLWAIQQLVKKRQELSSKSHVAINLLLSKQRFKERIEQKNNINQILIEYLFAQALRQNETTEEKSLSVEFSLIELEKALKKSSGLLADTIDEKVVRDSLFYLSRIGALTIEGGFMVIHNRMTIERKETNSGIRYKKVDYEQLQQFYKNKIEQIHIVGEYAKKMVVDYKAALQFVDDYFSLNYHSFRSKYFSKEQIEGMSKSISPKKFQELFGSLSTTQLKIVNDNESKYISVLAGPGSGKTKVLVHKLTSLLLLENVKSEQLLMLTFSRAAATEFKKRLFDLLGGLAAFVEIKTFHSYCFDLLGKVGSIEASDEILAQAVLKIKNKEVELNQIAKVVMVIDEGQDIREDEFELIVELIRYNDDMRVVMVGDDDQSIYTFRGASAEYLRRFAKKSQTYELLDNYRSKSNIVDFANQFVQKIEHRLKFHPILAKQTDNGQIKLFRYQSTGLISPLVKDLCNTDLTGTTIILTKTNEEAELVVSALKINNLPGKLIQSNDHFNLLNLQEIRFFVNRLHVQKDSPYISDDSWASAKQKFRSEFKSSPNFYFVNQLIKDFEETNRKVKYLTDLKLFIKESKIEDFLQADSELIYVSTMHKVKGKEFANVIVLLDNYDMSSNDAKRLVYVAITRAQNNLAIHTNGAYFDDIKVSNLSIKYITEKYPVPRQLILFTSLKDVHLGFFKRHQILIKKLKAGMELQPVDGGLAYNGQQVIAYSQNFAGSLLQKSKKGYRPAKAIISQLVYWQDKNEQPQIYEKIIKGKLVQSRINQEILVVLVEIWLEK